MFTGTAVRRAASLLRHAIGMVERIPGKLPQDATQERIVAVDVRRETQSPGGVQRSLSADRAPRPWPPLLTVAEVAELLRRSRNAVYAMVERGQLPGVTRIGRRLLACHDYLRSLLDENREAKIAHSLVTMDRG